MIINVNKIKVLKSFLDDPLKGFSIREISKKIELGFPSVRNYLKELENEKFLTKERKYKQELYFANRDYWKFKNFKIYYNIDLLFSSGLMDYINEKSGYSTLILYGSFSKGEDRKNSDIDLVLIGSKPNLKLEKYEKKINHKIHLISFKNIKKIPNELKLNIINGIILNGSINEI